MFIQTMKMDTQLWSLIKRFWEKNQTVVIGAVLTSIASHSIGTLIVPKTLSNVLASETTEQLKSNLIPFFVAYGAEKGIYMTSNIFGNLIEPALTKFLTRELVENVLRKFEKNRVPIEVAVVMDKIIMIRNAIEDLIYYLFIKLIPLTVVLFITVLNILRTNFKLGICVLVSLSVMMFVFWMLPSLPRTTNEKDCVSEFIEDIFNNADYITSTPNGIEQIVEKCERKVDSLHKNIRRMIQMVGQNQMIGYFFGVFLYISTILYAYTLQRNGEYDIKTFGTYLLTIGRLYEIVFDFAYYLPSFFRNIVMLKESERWLKGLYIHHKKKRTSIQRYDISFDNVSFQFKNQPIITNFSLEIPEHSFLTIYGDNGSGKTTFSNLILNLHSLKEGTIKIGGQDVSTIPPKDLYHLITCVRQNTTSLLEMTVYENIILGIESTKELRSSVEQLITDLQLNYSEGFLDKKVSKCGGNLSGGQKQIIHLLHCILNESSKIVILDEPTSSLDEHHSKCVIKLIERLHSNGKTILVISHDPELYNRSSYHLKFKNGKNPEKCIS